MVLIVIPLLLNIIIAVFLWISFLDTVTKSIFIALLIVKFIFYVYVSLITGSGRIQKAGFVFLTAVNILGMIFSACRGFLITEILFVILLILSVFRFIILPAVWHNEGR